MTVHFAKLLGRKDVAQDTAAFRFQRPVGVNYKVAQTVDIALNDPPAIDGNSLWHTFSLVSAPHETDLIVATRMRDRQFKRELEAASREPMRSATK
jgi:ferredoxin-NADP reductase